MRGHSGFFIPATTANDLQLRRISISDFIHYIYLPILILENEPVFPFSMLSAKQGNYWFLFYNVFGMTQSLTGNWTRDLPYSMPALYHSGYRGGGLVHIILESADGQSNNWSVWEMLHLKLLPKVSSHLNETCYTWSVWGVDVHYITLPMGSRVSPVFEILIYP